MKVTTNIKKGLRSAQSLYNLSIKGVTLSALILLSAQVSLQAQDDQYTKPSWWFGAAAGANLNYYRGSTQQLNSDLIVPTTFHDGKGVGLFIAPLMEYHNPDSKWGIMLQAGYDNRKGTFDEVSTPCNCPADLDAKITYLTIEPSLRFAPFKSNFYLYAGPRLAFNMSKSFTYKLGLNPAIPSQATTPAVSGDFSSMYKTLLSMQIGAGYDIPISSQTKRTQWILSPFVSFQPYFGQDPRSIETWNITTLRVGATIKFGSGSKIEKPYEEIKSKIVVNSVEPDVRFSVYSPANIPVERRVREVFPIRNYVFFDLGSSDIPERYILLKKDQVKDFKEDQLEVKEPKRLSGRSDREMIVYYNVLNILGDRMVKLPKSTIRLSGSSMQGKVDGKAMAESIKKYLVDIFGINPKRIKTEGRIKPLIASEQAGGTQDLNLLREGDRRVTIWSGSPEILMEFQSGPNAPLKPVEIQKLQNAPIDSYVTFYVIGAKEAFTSWSLEIKDENGVIQEYGPFTDENRSIYGKLILGDKPKGNFNATLIGKTKSGKIVKKEAPFHMAIWTPSKTEEGMRFSVLYEFNDSKAIIIYEKYLTNFVTPKIPKNGKVILSGYTDIIGDASNNQKLSLARANDVKSIIEKALLVAGRSDVKFEVYGFGEDQDFAPFDNKFPEERFYNRSVIIDIIPQE